MPVPNDSPCIPEGATLTVAANGQFELSDSLVQLLLQARSGYDWPAGTGPVISQQNILNLEALVNGNMMALTPNTAHDIIIAVSEWAGNNAISHANIISALPDQQIQMQMAVSSFITNGQECDGIDALCNLPGISLVIASKIFRFCSPNRGAAVDRHASYFFNSLCSVGGDAATHFAREWSNGRHTTSRLAIYTAANYARNKTEYFAAYLPTLACIADAMNAIPAPYTCAAQNTLQNWRPADVEMAAYYWWATNGSR